MLCVCVGFKHSSNHNSNQYYDNLVAPGDKRVIDSILLTAVSGGAPWPQGPMGAGVPVNQIYTQTHTLPLHNLKLIIIQMF